MTDEQYKKAISLKEQIAIIQHYQRVFSQTTKNVSKISLNDIDLSFDEIIMKFLKPLKEQLLIGLRESERLINEEFEKL